MPRLFTEDVPPERPPDARPTVPGSSFDVDDPRVIRFDDEAYEDLQRLQRDLRNAEDVTSVVYTALELLALALSYDLKVESKLGRGEKRVYNLWR